MQRYKINTVSFAQWDEQRSIYLKPIVKHVVTINTDTRDEAVALLAAIQALEETDV